MSNTSQAAALVTVIVPTIGRPEFIVDTLRSVLAQTYAHLQILISDNAPAEPTAVLLAAAGISDARIEIVQRMTRLGFSAHMNACIAQARGTYLMIVSDDDQIAPDYVAEMVTLMSSQPQISICLGRQIQINEHDRGLMPEPGERRPCQVVDGVQFLTGSLARTLDTGVMTYISMFVRRADILKAGGFKDYPDGSHADNFIVLRLAISGQIALASSLMFYRVYLASFGLRTPFSALLEATRAYTHDAAAAVQQSSLGAEQRRALVELVRSANTRMLFGRLHGVYRHRLNPWQLLVCVVRVVQFRLRRLPS